MSKLAYASATRNTGYTTAVAKALVHSNCIAVCYNMAEKRVLYDAVKREWFLANPIQLNIAERLCIAIRFGKT